MKIVAAEARTERLPLSRPYTIAFRTISEIETAVVELRDQAGHVGLGAASPEPYVTGETSESCRAALCAPGALDFLVGADLVALPALLADLGVRLPRAPAARAALDMALHDLLARWIGVPLGHLLGRAQQALPTSITIGIKPTDEALAEADEYLGRGFRILKVKIGRSLEEDLERLTRLRERVGPEVKIRADANQGYSLDETRRLFAAAAGLDLELVEQPVAAAAIGELAALPEAARDRVAADESLLGPAEALALAALPPQTRPAGIFNIKLMKCGGIRPALDISAIAGTAGISLMWGCNDESRIAIAAALNAALASPATRYLDLDGSFDLARDVAAGGFVLEDGGLLRPVDAPGLGATLVL
jgi:L-alanine-DL-glutamate epimerase-like enolase superfamily enzyme